MSECVNQLGKPSTRTQFQGLGQKELFILGTVRWRETKLMMTQPPCLQRVFQGDTDFCIETDALQGTHLSTFSQSLTQEGRLVSCWAAVSSLLIILSSLVQ